MTQDLWSKLEAELEAQPASGIQIPDTLAPPTARPKLKERLAAGVLSGAIPLILIGLLSIGMVGLWEGHQSGFGLELALIGVVVWLLRPLFFPGTRPARWLLLLMPILAGGYFELSSTLTDIGGAYVRSDEREFEAVHAIKILQNHLESFFSLSHFLIYLVLGLAFLWGIRKTEQNFYYLDLKAPGKARRILSLLAGVVTPAFLFLGGVYTVANHPWSAREKAWLDSLQRIHTVEPWRIETKNQRDRWWALHKDIPIVNNQRIFPSAKDSQKLEEALLRDYPSLLKGENLVDLAVSSDLLQELANKPEYLSHPEKVALALINHPFLKRNSYGDARNTLIAVGLVQFGAESPLPELNKPDTLWSVDTAREKFHQPLEMLDSVVANTLDDEASYQLLNPSRPTRPAAYEAPQEIKLLGKNFDFGLAPLYYRWRVRNDLNWWLDLREQILTQKLSPSDIRLRLQQEEAEFGEDERLPRLTVLRRIHWFSDPVRAENVLTAAAVLARDIRNFKEENGRWPASLEEVPSQSTLDYDKKQLKFDAESHTLIYTPIRKREVPRRWVLQ